MINPLIWSYVDTLEITIIIIIIIIIAVFRLLDVLEFAEGMEIEIPNIWSYFGELVGQMIQDGSVPLSFLKQAAEPLIDSNKAGIFVAEVLHDASHREVSAHEICSPKMLIRSAAGNIFTFLSILEKIRLGTPWTFLVPFFDSFCESSA